EPAPVTMATLPSSLRPGIVFPPRPALSPASASELFGPANVEMQPHEPSPPDQARSTPHRREPRVCLTLPSVSHTVPTWSDGNQFAVYCRPRYSYARTK